jgi:pyochelin synthetase
MPFFAAGGDSLLAARLAGRILEEIPDARSLFFDDLLRQIHVGPTRTQLAAAIATGGPATELLFPATAEHGSAHAASPNQITCIVFDDGSIGPIDEAPLSKGDSSVRVVRVSGHGAVMSHETAAAYPSLPRPWPSIVGINAGAGAALELGRQLLEQYGTAPLITILQSTPTPDRLANERFYAGDLQLIRPRANAASDHHWHRLCLGELEVEDVERIDLALVGYILGRSL